MCSLVVTNISVIITFDTNPLTSAGVNYEDTLWKQQFAYNVYNQITQVRQYRVRFVIL